MYSQWGNITHRAAQDIFKGALLTLTEDLEYALAGADTETALFAAVDECKQGIPCAARSTCAATGSIEMTAVAGTYSVGAPVYAAAGGKISAAGTRIVGYYHGATKTTAADSRIEVILADRSAAAASAPST